MRYQIYALDVVAVKVFDMLQLICRFKLQMQNTSGGEV